jgi:hypothetical protein
MISRWIPLIRRDRLSHQISYFLTGDLSWVYLCSFVFICAYVFLCMYLCSIVFICACVFLLFVPLFFCFICRCVLLWCVPLFVDDKHIHADHNNRIKVHRRGENTGTDQNKYTHVDRYLINRTYKTINTYTQIKTNE